jgi:hypothetical protein
MLRRAVLAGTDQSRAQIRLPLRFGSDDLVHLGKEEDGVVRCGGACQGPADGLKDGATDWACSRC